MVWFGVWDSRVLNTYGCVVSAEIYKSKVTTIYNIFLRILHTPPKISCDVRTKKRARQDICGVTLRSDTSECSIISLTTKIVFLGKNTQKLILRLLFKYMVPIPCTYFYEIKIRKDGVRNLISRKILNKATW